jgi:hypothetical protein
MLATTSYIGAGLPNQGVFKMLLLRSSEEDIFVTPHADSTSSRA